MVDRGQTRIAGLIPAAGAGLRLGGDGPPKAWRLLGGRPMVAHAVDMLAAVCDLIIVAQPPGSNLHVDGATVVSGGATRAESVRLLLAALPPDVDLVLVHDAARPYAPIAVAERVIDALLSGEQAVVPVVPVVDTVKRVDAAGYVLGTLDRATLRAVQTPQGFHRAALDAAHAAAGDATDDAALVEQVGIAVRTVAGDPAAAKITTAADLAAARERP